MPEVIYAVTALRAIVAELIGNLSFFPAVAAQPLIAFAPRFQMPRGYLFQLFLLREGKRGERDNTEKEKILPRCGEWQKPFTERFMILCLIWNRAMR